MRWLILCANLRRLRDGQRAETSISSCLQTLALMGLGLEVSDRDLYYQNLGPQAFGLRHHIYKIIFPDSLVCR